jgi:hypothetical protein
MGNVSEAGWECLSESTRLLPKIYPEFDFVICYNSLDNKETQRLRSFKIDLYEQKEENLEVPHTFHHHSSVSNHSWKLCPIRLRPEAHELWVDNDVVITDRIPDIDDWLNKDKPIISTVYGKEAYGRFKEALIMRLWGVWPCAGLFGLPPRFGFKEKLLEGCNGVPLEGFDEQGLVVSIVTKEKGWMPIEPKIFNQVGWFNRFVLHHEGYHFIRLNTGTNSAWEHYKMITSPDPKICNNMSWMYRQEHVLKKGTMIQQRFIAP